MAESTDRVLATRLWELTDDPGMKDMLSFLIARDIMHQNQWLAAIEDLGGIKNNLPIPNSFPASEQVNDLAYAFVSTNIEKPAPPADARWTSGPSIDGKGEFSYVHAQPYGPEPVLGMPDVKGHAQMQQMSGSEGKDLLENIKDTILP